MSSPLEPILGLTWALLGLGTLAFLTFTATATVSIQLQCSELTRLNFGSALPGATVAILLSLAVVVAVVVAWGEILRAQGAILLSAITCGVAVIARQSMALESARPMGILPDLSSLVEPAASTQLPLLVLHLLAWHLVAFLVAMKIRAIRWR